MRAHRAKSLHAWLLAALLLAAQALGLAHGISHAPGLHPAHGITALPGFAAAPHAHGDRADDHSHGHDAGTAECRLVDQLGHADGLCGTAVLALPEPFAATAVAAPARPALLPARAAAYQARAPPAVRRG